MERTDPSYVVLVSVDGVFNDASNATLLARDREGTRWVYKPDEGERPLWDFPTGTLSRREIACFRVSRAAGLDVVPETLLAEGPYGAGSAQRFLDQDLTWDPRPLIVAADDRLWPVAVLDLIVNNADRKIGHLLRQPEDDRIWAIDNGLSFHTDDKLRTVLWSFAGQPIPQPIIGRLDADQMTLAVGDLLAPAEVEATAVRVSHLLDDPVHPLPPSDRPPMPWPLW
ncbi:MAG TPA: phosphatidylinositol kinase [Acidimicrobiia bacterium]|nr:phosphatidylinositol kinase [Acidimicrobiia bacterium]